ncbi:hypothetical protein EGR_08177 [Echinococcus granulosus]|uniref:Uncharacterized protein n=1 Tax=Echinococcus granulosus TaxID=6210 RepID=W6U6Y2_ECHGR|nr:hypothetical protein EGR_08177 [Echinococcus granulosus]EUB56940.1 hypothetical protein EGR_08177 [Echinococcus granulosus]
MTSSAPPSFNPVLKQEKTPDPVESPRRISGVAVNCLLRCMEIRRPAWLARECLTAPITLRWLKRKPSGGSATSAWLC